ncbi:protein-L-isoaspartate O-methyltransferase [Microvirga sp. GCM10011540]|uniref:protein-L-isoaspartate O-methyltransferase family protein n=1 Tax=Microvirga sp. GCM10011540 TaxID=3317338 RepID=UPI0036154E65
MSGSIVFDDKALSIVRRAYARQMLAVAGIEYDFRLEEAFASVPREHFLGAPPWLMSGFGGYKPLPSGDPVLVYQDVNFALSPSRGVNNGSPSLHARWLHQAGLKPGERVAHIGAGTGYYTALIADLVGSLGQVLAVEFDPALADMARRNLEPLANVTVVQGDGAEWPREEVDCVYVNFLVQRPADAWIERLALGGRLIFPLGVPRPQRSPVGGMHTLHGAGLRIERRAGGFAARWLGAAYFVCAEGALAGSPEESAALKAAFERGGVEFVRSLAWKEPGDPGRCWFSGPDWSLSYDEAA